MSTPTLAPGLQGSAVQTLQQDLQSLGYDIGFSGADGVFGTGTEAAVMAFQLDAGVPTTGVVEQDTWDAISAKLGPTAIPSSNATIAPSPSNGGAQTALAQPAGSSPLPLILGASVAGVGLLVVLIAIWRSKR